MNPQIPVTDEMVEELAELTKTITAIPAPSNDEWRRVEYLMTLLPKWGYPDIFRDDADNVMIEVGDFSDASQKVVLYSAHTDTVFPDTTPLPVREENGILYGPGIGDDTANLSAMILCLRYIKEAGFTPKRPLAYACDTGEEGLGNLRGMRGAYAHYRGRILHHIAFDGSTDHVVNRAVGSHRYEITVLTKGGHSYGAFGNRNAIASAASAISALYTMSTAELSGITTYNVGTIEGGNSVNSIAQKAVFRFEYRSDCQDSLLAMRDMSAAKTAEGFGIPGFSLSNGYIGKAGGVLGVDKDAIEVHVKLIGDRPGNGPVDETSQAELCSHVADILEKHTGLRPEYESGSTDCNIPLSEGVPAVCFGVYLGSGAHTREEHIEKASMKAGLEAMLELMLEEYM